MPPPPAEHGTTNRWRTTCRCADCRGAHNLDSLARRRAHADITLPADVRRKLLRAIRKGASVPEAADAVGLIQQTVWGRARRDEQWRTELDEALMAGRRNAVPHGTPAGYRHHRCRCPECRSAHHRPVEA